MGAQNCCDCGKDITNDAQHHRCDACNDAARAPKGVDGFLVHVTGHPRTFWVAKVQEEIGRASYKVQDQVHDETWTANWLTCISTQVASCVDRHPDVTNAKTDGNILAARVMTVILGTWAARVIRAKTYDPRRPIDKRQQALARLVQFQTMMLEAMVDESHDHEHFPGQEWDDPWAPGAKDGGYV